MMLAICAKCGDQMYLKEVAVQDLDADSFMHIYILSCENNHKITTEGSRVTKHPTDPMLKQIIKYLLQNRSIKK